MSFTNKAIQMTDFLARLHERIKATGNIDARIFFEVFLQDVLVGKIKSNFKVPPDWDGLATAGYFDQFYPFAVELLFDAAARNLSEHQNLYGAAHAVSVAFCGELNDLFQCSGVDGFDLIPIISAADGMV